ncbi:uncharacterized protein BX663DRAFT_511638 [Cokeromyces recurvatus]|uniref:uncharacterized protein n=1 Tax=Cokeromyces recurvatus TaxID=90255 RepID=UPI00221F74E7|nr:uncharacterized protein BX663DRAFT_511638 [Cokeromyces recurvatus]KAI7902064.1 hypothetical protein BX663DRAFT_511638 [Cokeromyces recurvatus]
MIESNDSQDAHTVNENFAQILREMCTDAKELYECNQKRKRETETLKKVYTKRIKFYTCTDFEPKLGVHVQELTTTAENIESKIRSYERLLIEKALKHIMPLYDTKDILTLPTKEDMESRLKISLFELQIENLVEKLTPLFSSKLDASEKSDFENNLEEAKKYLLKYFEETENESKEKFKELENLMNDLNKQIEDLVSEDSMNQLVESTAREMLGLPSLKEIEKEYQKFDIKRLEKDALHDLLGKQLIYQITNKMFSKDIIYPTTTDNKSLQAKNLAKIRKNHHERNKVKASIIKIDKMEKETNDVLTSFEKNLNADSIQYLFKNLDHINNITNNHQEVLEYINAPNGETSIEHTCLPDKVKDYLPPSINLYKRDYRLSESLARTIAQYTDLYYFADLRRRIDTLEKKI